MSVYYFHPFLMFSGFILLCSGFIAVKFFRRKRWWLKFHKITNVVGSFLILTSVFAILIYKFTIGGQHLKSPHSYIGFFIAILTIINPFIGFLQIKGFHSSINIKKIHRISGRLLIGLMAFNIILGLFIV
ncbi:MAG TPA: hypothetical protein PLM71_08880 [Syntrophorhabdaceae bacterium]|nr:hypothetical protein [Syntrophorhabdaceae bacterium]